MIRCNHNKDNKKQNTTKKERVSDMTRKELFAKCKEMNIKVKATMKTVELEMLLNEAKKEREKEMKENKTKKAYKREKEVENIASVVPTECYDNNCIIKLMSNKSVAVKKDKKRLFRLDRLNKEYQLTSDRDTLAIDSRVDCIEYKYRGSKEEVQDIMKKVIANC